MNKPILDLKASFCGALVRLIYGTKRTECSKVMEMDGRVKSAEFIKSHYELQSAPHWGNNMFDNDPNIYLFAKIPDQYLVTFNSERGAITLQTEEAFKRFENHENELVTISYCEIRQSIYHKKTNELIKYLDIDLEVLGIVLK